MNARPSPHTSYLGNTLDDVPTLTGRYVDTGRRVDAEAILAATQEQFRAAVEANPKLGSRPGYTLADWRAERNAQ